MKKIEASKWFEVYQNNQDRKLQGLTNASSIRNVTMYKNLGYMLQNIAVSQGIKVINIESQEQLSIDEVSKRIVKNVIGVKYDIDSLIINKAHRTNSDKDLAILIYNGTTKALELYIIKANDKQAFYDTITSNDNKYTKTNVLNFNRKELVKVWA